jgi:hypothetical protein
MVKMEDLYQREAKACGFAIPSGIDQAYE